MCRWIRALLLSLVLVGCQAGPPALPVDEARSVATDFGAPGFIPPPRTINDITAILDEQKPDESYRNALLARLNSTPSVSTAAGLSNNFRIHANAALNLGRGSEALAAARESVRYAREASENLDTSLMTLGVAEWWVAGDGYAAWREAYEFSRNRGRWSTAMTSMRLLTEIAVGRGDLATAKQLVEESDRILTSRNRSDAAYPTSVANNAEAHFFFEMGLGRFSEAEIWERRAIVSYDAYAASANIGDIATDIGSAWRRVVVLRAGLSRNLLAQGRMVEAEAVAREALLYALRHFGQASPGTAAAADNLGQVLFMQGRARDAERLFAAANLMRVNLGMAADNGRNWEANATAMQGRWIEALTMYKDTDQGRTEISPYVIYPRILALYHAGRVAEGLALAKPAADGRARAYGEDSPDTALAKGFVAAGLALQGDRSAALVIYRSVIPILVRASGARTETEDQGTPSQEYRRFVVEAYLRLLVGSGSVSATESDIAIAFQIADSLRGSSTERMVTSAAARANLRNADFADLARREQDTQQQIAARLGIVANALSKPVEQQNAAALVTVRAEVENLRAARGVLLEQISKRFPEYDQLVHPQPATIEQARSALTAGEALVTIYTGANESYAWAVTKTGAVAFATVPLNHVELAASVTHLRRALDPNATTLGAIPPFDVAAAHALFEAFLAPVRTGWQRSTRLIVAPHGPMSELPFSLLVTRDVAQPQEREGQALFSGYRELPFLAREMVVTQVPTVTALVNLRGLPAGSATRRAFAGFGDPWFSQEQAAQARRESRESEALAASGLRLRSSPATGSLASATLADLPRLPDTAVEVRDVAAAMHADPGRDVFLGAAANERQIRTMKLDDRRVVMFATHGLVPGDLDGLAQPALALTAPNVAGVDGDGLLTMEKILGLKLDADWVVLSACNTAAGSGAGAEAVSGLGRAFFYAGARALLVTNWPVETSSARALTTTLFQRQARDAALSRAGALHASMLELIDGPGFVDNASARIVFSYAHPIFWAPFSLIGD